MVKHPNVLYVQRNLFPIRSDFILQREKNEEVFPEIHAFESHTNIVGAWEWLLHVIKSIQFIVYYKIGRRMSIKQFY